MKPVISPVRSLCEKNLRAWSVYEEHKFNYKYMLLNDALILFDKFKLFDYSPYLKSNFKRVAKEVGSFYIYPESLSAMFHSFFDTHGVQETVGMLQFRRIYFKAMGMTWSMGYVTDLAQVNSGRRGSAPLDLSIEFNYTGQGKEYLFRNCPTCYDAVYYILKLFIYGGYNHILKPREVSYREDGYLL